MKAKWNTRTASVANMCPKCHEVFTSVEEYAIHKQSEHSEQTLSDYLSE